MTARVVEVAAPDAGMRLDKWLALRTDAGSRGRAAKWLASGKVFVNDQPVDASAAARKIVAGDRIRIWIDRPGSSRPADRLVREARPLLRIVHEDSSIVVVDKPVGWLVEPLPRSARAEPTLLDLLDDRYRHLPRARSYVVHRIDRDTSGLVLFARTLAARDALKAQFEARSPSRLYLAVVLGRISPASGTWRDSLAWDPSSLRQRRAHARDARGKDAEAHYRVQERFAAATLIEVTLVTGKRNQIRVQAAMRGHPLLGERQYRFDAPPEPAGLPRIDRQALHAWKLGFQHPTTARQVMYTSPLPPDLSRLIASLRRA
jgi:23S rRNA pseudouridine1911/1915/1917 synthase